MSGHEEQLFGHYCWSDGHTTKDKTLQLVKYQADKLSGNAHIKQTFSMFKNHLEEKHDWNGKEQNMKGKINKEVVERKYKRNQLNQKEFNLSTEVNHALDNIRKKSTAFQEWQHYHSSSSMRSKNLSSEACRIGSRDLIGFHDVRWKFHSRHVKRDIPYTGRFLD